MKKGWEMKRLGDVCEVIAGQSPEGKYYNEKGDGMPFYQGKKEFTEKYIGSPKVWTTKVTKEAIKDDILMSVRAPVGPINFSTQNICIGRGLASIRASSKINKEFLYNFLLKHEKEIIGNIGAVFDSINKKQIEDITILVPSLEEQQRIVSILDKSLAEIEKVKKLTEENLKNAKELFDSYLQGVFENKGEDWEEKTLGECFKLKSGENITAKMMVENGEYPVYGGNGIAGRYNKYNLSGSNVIVGRVGALCGNVRHIEESIWLTDNGFKITDYNFEFDNAFLTYLLNYKKLRSYARQAAQPVISNSSLEGVLLSFPKPLQEQQSIVKKLDKLSAKTKRLETIYQQKLDSLEELKKSILQKAFNGEL